MPDELFGDRRKSLEEAFFSKQNAKLVEKLRAEQEAVATKEALAQISGIESEDVLDRLAELGIDASVWAAISLVPLVEVAWADGKVEEAERQSILRAAEASGIDPDSASRALLASWLDQRGDGRLLEVWEAFITGLCADLGAVERNALRDQVVGRARDVAEAAGGFWGLGNKTSALEEAVLVRLSKAFGD